jgi:hypothetical protein
VALFSILMSAASAGFASANISFDYDCDPEKRKNDPRFYGYVPDGSLQRTAIFVCMLVNSALLLIVRGFSMAVLIQVDNATDNNYVKWSVLLDHGLL